VARRLATDQPQQGIRLNPLPSAEGWWLCRSQMRPHAAPASAERYVGARRLRRHRARPTWLITKPSPSGPVTLGASTSEAGTPRSPGRHSGQPLSASCNPDDRKRNQGDGRDSQDNARPPDVGVD
jgi:hypothetical protein